MSSSPLFLLNHYSWNERLSSTPVSVVVASLVTALFSVLFYFFRELSKTFNKRPSHFVGRSWFDSWSQPKVNAPLVEVVNNDYREALARGSKQV